MSQYLHIKLINAYGKNCYQMDHFKTLIPKRPKFIVLQVTFTSKLKLRGTHKLSESNIQNLRSAFARIVNDVAYPEAA